MILHVLHETGQLGLPDLEGHIKDDIEREGTRISEMTRKVRQAYQDIVSATISGVRRSCSERLIAAF